LDDVQPLHDVVEGGPLCRLRLQAAAHEVDYVLELLPRGVGRVGGQHVAYVGYAQLLLANGVVLNKFGHRQVGDSLIRDLTLHDFEHDHAECVHFAALARLGRVVRHELGRHPGDARGGQRHAIAAHGTARFALA
jgi:hypothetical protein